MHQRSQAWGQNPLRMDEWHRARILLDRRIPRTESFSRIVHVEPMYLPDPTPDNHVETRFDRDGDGTWMTLRMTLPDEQTGQP